MQDIFQNYSKIPLAWDLKNTGTRIGLSNKAAIPYFCKMLYTLSLFVQKRGKPYSSLPLFKLISTSYHSRYILASNFPSDLTDHVRHRCSTSLSGFLPDGFINLGLAKNPSGMFCQKKKRGKFQVGKWYFFSVLKYPMLIRLDGESWESKYWNLFCGNLYNLLFIM